MDEDPKTVITIALGEVPGRGEVIVKFPEGYTQTLTEWELHSCGHQHDHIDVGKLLSWTRDFQAIADVFRIAAEQLEDLERDW